MASPCSVYRGRPALWALALLLSMAAALFPMAHPRVAAQAPPPPSISLLPTSGPVGTSVSVTGSNFPANTAVTVSYDAASVSSVTSSGTGAWSVSFPVPASALGPHTVQAGTATAAFTVTSVIGLSIQTGPQGTGVIITGSGFSSSQTGIAVTFGGAQVAVAAATAAGSFSTSFVVPAVPAGSYLVVAGSAPPQSFSVTSTLAIVPSAGPVGAMVNVTGSGFSASAVVSITLDGRPVSTVTTSTQGSLTSTFQIPSLPGGGRTVAVAGSGGPQATLTVTPSLTVDRATAVPGGSVSVTGTGFAASEGTITITFDGVAVMGGIMADAQGSWLGSFVVPQGAAGSHILGAFGAQTSAAAVPPVTLSLSGGIRLDRASGPPGTTVRVSGFGFAANAQGIVVTAAEGLASASASASAQGVWITTLTIPSVPGGPLAIRASGSGALPAEATFTVTPSISLSQSAGTPGAAIAVQGSGFGANQANITLALGAASTIVSANAGGSWTAMLTVPALPSGLAAVRTGGSAPLLEAPFSITPSISLSADRGAPGAQITVTGAGFGANQRDITVAIGQTIVAPAIAANPDGSWRATLTVPSFPSGPYPVRTGGSAAGVEAPFTIGPAISLSADRGTPGTQITVTGAGFGANQRDISLTFGDTVIASGVAANAAGGWSATVTVPLAASGTYAVRSGGSGPVLEASFTVGPAISLSVDRGAPGTQVTVTGTGFGANQRGISLSFGQSVAASGITANASGSWTATVAVPPAPSGTHAIRSGGAAPALEASFTVNPAISLSVERGAPGTSVTVNGAGFPASQRGITVTFGQETVASAIAANAEGSWSATMTVPPSPSGTHAVRSGGAAPLLEASFTTVPGVSVSADRAAPGARVTVTGVGFGANERGISIAFGQTTVASGIAADARGSWTNAFPIPTLPASAYDIRVSGTAISAATVPGATLTIAPGATVTPAQGSPGTTVTLSGSGFPAGERNISVAFDGVPVVSGLAADGQGVLSTPVVVPASPSGPHAIKISGAAAGAPAAEATFQVTPAVSLGRTSGPPGAPIAVSGAGFGANEANIAITFGGVPVLQAVRADVQGSFGASFPAPRSPAGPHLVQASRTTTLAGAPRTEQSFTITPALTLDPSSGHVGMSVMVAGSGFAASSTVTVLYEGGMARVSAQADATGSLRADLVIPRSRGGERSITAQDSGGNSSRAVFAMDSEAPAAPRLASPKSGSRGGAFSGYRPTLGWTGSQDPSGATYTLQLDSDAAFSNPRLAKHELATPSYALSGDEGLPRGRYYWRVRATDGASNEGPWSEAFAVTSGTVPIWIVPVLALIVLGALAATAYVFVLRPRWRRPQPVPVPAAPRAEQPAPTVTTSLPQPRRPALGPPPRLSLPAPSRRGRTLSLEDRARLQRVVDFLRSMPLLQVAPDLGWLRELIAATPGVIGEFNEDILAGRLPVRYQPAWTRHPTYDELQRLLQGQPFLTTLNEYMAAVDACAADAIALLRGIHGDLAAAFPQAPRDHTWRLAVATGQDVLAWLRGTYLKEPSARDYVLESAQDPSGTVVVSLFGAEEAPFRGLLTGGLSGEQATGYSNTHIQLRSKYRNHEQARALDSSMTRVGLLREQLLHAIALLDQVR